MDVSAIRKVAPVAFIYGKDDLLANTKDTLALATLVKPVYTKVINGGHVTYLVGKDMTYFRIDVM